MTLEKTKKRRAFLSAYWHNLIFANYTIDPEELAPLVPKGTTLDFYKGNCYISLVAFQFLDTKILGIPALTKRNFDEINLRFYVKRTLKDGSQQGGVVFVKEIVQSRLIAWVARTLYGENYVSMTMDREIRTINRYDTEFTYMCGTRGPTNTVSAVVSTNKESSGYEELETYITEHYWGYSTHGHNRTMEYEVNHPKWTINNATAHSINFDFEGVYGTRFRLLSDTEPTSVFYCNGSNITVHLGKMISE